MEIIAGLIMIVGGAAVAVFVLAAITISRSAAERERVPSVGDRDEIVASILFQILVNGGDAPDEVLRRLRRAAGIAARVTQSIDVASWGGRFAQTATLEQRTHLLETAVQLVSARKTPVPLRQYNALLDLSFGLGFQTDALARLREQYGFDYVDHAKDARPREADRGGGATPLFDREQFDARELLRVLEIDSEASRHDIISAYRKLAARYHPDKHFHESGEAQQAAAARFIEITAAYEKLLARNHD